MGTIILTTNSGWDLKHNGELYSINGGYQFNTFDDSVIKGLMKENPFLQDMEAKGKLSVTFGNEKMSPIVEKATIENQKQSALKAAAGKARNIDVNPNKEIPKEDAPKFDDSQKSININNNPLKKTGRTIKGK